MKKILHQSERNPPPPPPPPKKNKIKNKKWIDNGNEFYNITTKIRPRNKFNKGKFVAAERYIRTLKTKICKHITTISKHAYW